MTDLLFLDTETTSLDAATGEIWEVGAILRGADGFETEHHWFLPVDLAHADPVSLEIGRFHQRHPNGDGKAAGVTTPIPLFLGQFALLSSGTHLVGNVISFDEERLRRMYDKLNGDHAGPNHPGWHYHLVDVEALVAGRFGIRPPWKSSELTKAVGVQHPNDDDHHTAIGDAKWAMRLYDAAMNRVDPVDHHALGVAWLIANAHGGDWELATDEWRTAAERWRDWAPIQAKS